MKKNYDWNIPLKVTISNNQKKLQIGASVHTNIHQLKVQIAKILNLPLLDTSIELYYRSQKPLKSVSTLLQNDITQAAHITAIITRTKETPSLYETLENKSKKIDNVGLRIVSSCTNPNCVNYNQKVEVNYGLGEFHILQLTSFAKCEICPYKSQHLRPSMMCHEVTVNKCLYLLKGTLLNSSGIPQQKSTGYQKAIQVKNISKFLTDHPWHQDMRLLIKPL